MQNVTLAGLVGGRTKLIEVICVIPVNLIHIEVSKD